MKLQSRKFILPFLVYFICLIATFFAWDYAHIANNTAVREKFRNDVQIVVEKQTRERLDAVMTDLYSTQGFLFSGNSITSTAFNKFIAKLSQTTKYSKKNSYFLLDNELNIIYAFPSTASNISALYNIKTNTDILTAVQSALKTQQVSIAAPYLNNGKKLLTFFAPLYNYSTSTTKNGTMPVGYLAISINAIDFFSFISDAKKMGLNMEIFDNKQGSLPTIASLLFDTNPDQVEAIYKNPDKIRAVSSLPILGKTWSMFFSVSPEYGLSVLTSFLPFGVLVIGFFISFLFSGIIYSLSTSKSRAENIALDMTQKLRESEKQIESILFNIADGVFVIDNQQKIILLNDAAATMCGWKITDALGKNYNDIFHIASETDPKENMLAKPIITALQSGQITKNSNHSMLRNKKGEMISITESISPLIDKSDRIIGCIIVFHDVTKERRIEKMKDEFISLASHQLRTPLTAIKLFVEMLQREEVGSLNLKQKEYMDNVFQSTSRMVRLVNDLLNVSRIESGRLRIEPEKIQLENFVTEMTKDFCSLAKAHNCEFIVKRPVKPFPLIDIDTTLMRQVIYNLLSNAIRYSPPKQSKIWVSVAKNKAREYVISVKDEGIGIAKEAQDRIFQKFFRADDAVKSVADGSGLGLYMAKLVLDASGGKIYFKSKGAGKGTIFYVTLPKTGMKKKMGEKGLTPIK